MLCRSCLRDEAGGTSVDRGGVGRRLARLVGPWLGLLLAWLLFFLAAEGVRRLPDRFHDTGGAQATE